MRRRNLWEELKSIKEQKEGLWIMMGDFNEVREEGDRMISRFDNHNAMIFNTFIAESGLLEYQMGGYKFTYMPEDGSSPSKIDRVLVCNEFMNIWPMAKFEALARNLSDHSPISLVCSSPDFGPIPFRFYNSWLELNGIEEVVHKVLGEHGDGSSSVKEVAGILKKLKGDIKQWISETKRKQEKELNENKKAVEDIEKMAETRSLTRMEKEKRIQSKWKIKKYEKRRLEDLK
ncbi:uncharacterized protein LOC110919302 [Helianthus annuus]|uniref:uncharacterized protein LOC110919302 n=1 Tax=Helianthus annuus TaxID=4232 RepID=UPI000B8F1027|nr:uncharacterized protein LOC110919302 [Helianthus annuus]